MRVIDKFKKDKTTKMINVRVPIAIHEKFVRQIHLDKQEGLKTNISQLIIQAIVMYLDDREKPTLKQRFNRVIRGKIPKRNYTGRRLTGQV